MASRLERKLEGLRYPYGWKDAEMTVAHVRQMVTWLEDTKIMWWQIADRKKLKETEDEGEWMQVFIGYARDMGYTKPVGWAVGEPLASNVEVRALLDWVVGKAVRLHYTDGDNAEKYARSHEKYASLGMSIVTKVRDAEEVLDIETDLQYDVSDVDGMKGVLERLLALLGLPANDDVESALMLVSRTVADIRSVEYAKKDAAKCGATFDAKTPTALLDAMQPEGLQAQDPALEKAVRLLRVLFTIDLSELQRRITEIFCELQSVTHNIKEDIRAGRVGR